MASVMRLDLPIYTDILYQLSSLPTPVHFPRKIDFLHILLFVTIKNRFHRLVFGRCLSKDPLFSPNNVHG